MADNDLAPTIASVEPGAAGAGDDAVPEGADLVYTVTLSNASAAPVSFPFTLGGGTAAPGDFGSPVFSNGVVLNADGTITVPAGVTAFTVSVPTVQDSLDETNESVPLSVGGVAATGTITDDDAAPTLSIGDVTVDESAGTMSFTVTLSAPSALPVTVDYSTGNDSALSGTDFTAGSGTLSFAPGVTSQTVTVAIVDDTTDEPDETFSVNLSGATNATVADGTAVGTIADNDLAPTIASVEPGAAGAGDDAVPEGASWSTPSR